MNRGMVEILSELGRRLNGFGEGNTRLAATNLAHDMLSPKALSEWCALYPALPVASPRRVLIIMAGNIPLVGVHDLVCVLAAGHRAIVKPSSKDFENMSWVVGQLLDIEPGLPVELLSADSPAPDAVIAMGGNDAVAAIAEAYRNIPMLMRGHRSSLAILSGAESADELAGLADDVLSFSGLGCRNVSLVFVPRKYDFSELQYAISQRVNSLEVKYRNNLKQARAMLRMTGVPHLDCEACILVENRDFSATPSILNYAHYDTLHEVTDWIIEHDTEIQCVSTNCRPPIVDNQLNRAVKLGKTQHPHLEDYPDGRDTMQFLMTI
jgi:hypothetical protein